MNTCPRCGSDKMDTFRRKYKDKFIKEDYCHYCGYHKKVENISGYAPL